MLLQGMMKSYFGGLLCVCWSPDGRYVVTGGEDDLVTVWSFAEGRVVARGHGHKSWVNAVAFDPFTGAAQTPQPGELSGGRGGGGRAPRPAGPPLPRRHLPLRLGGAGHAVLPVGPDRGRPLPPALAAPRPHPHRLGGRRRPHARAATLALPLQQPPAAGGDGLGPRAPPRRPPGPQRWPFRHADAPGTEGTRKGTQTLSQFGQHQPKRGETPPAPAPAGGGWIRPRCWARRCAPAFTRCRCWSPSSARKSPTSA
ncbi:unnamed protein product [Bubo scandiacus]